MDALSHMITNASRLCSTTPDGPVGPELLQRLIDRLSSLQKPRTCRCSCSSRTGCSKCHVVTQLLVTAPAPGRHPREDAVHLSAGGNTISGNLEGVIFIRAGLMSWGTKLDQRRSASVMALITGRAVLLS